MTTQPEALPTLPTPDANRAEWDGGWRQYHDQHDLLPDQWDDEKPDSIVPLFTADQMRAYATEHAARLHAECESLRADRDSWERQCSDRVDDAVEFLQQRDEARAECEALRATQSDTLLRLLCDLRFALGDDGARMQHDLVEYARGLRADAERWRCFRTFVAGKSTRGFLNGKPAAYMVLPAITVERVGMTLDESIDAARAAKEQA